MPAFAFYRRRFERRAEPGYDREALRELAASMQPARVPEKPSVTRRPSDGLLPAIFTYFGQFIDHDLTLEMTPLKQAGELEPEKMINYRTPALDLDQLYGAGPLEAPELYDPADLPTEARFALGWTVAANGAGPTLNDLPRDEHLIARVADPRQDENLIIAQLHGLFLKFHNRVIQDNDLLGPKDSVYWQAGNRFAAARRFVTWHYQWLVLHEFLRNLIIQPAPGERHLLDILLEREFARPAPPQPYALPVEFSMAAFRFGHSMVRHEYTGYNEEIIPTLPLLLAMTGHGGGLAATNGLPQDFVIGWPNFLTSYGVLARRIDTTISQPLFELAGGISPVYAGSGEQPKTLSLPELTLLRGFANRLASGQDVAKAMGLTPFSAEQLCTGAGAGIVRKSFSVQTPLWYYVLKEAEIHWETVMQSYEAERKQIPLGLMIGLGEMGSRLVAETLLEVLHADPDSYLNVEPQWTPAPQLSRRGEFRLDSIRAAVRC